MDPSPTPTTISLCPYLGTEIQAEVLVAKSLTDTAKRFGKPTPPERVKAWLKTLTTRPPESRTLHATHSAVVTQSGSVRAIVDYANPTDRQRIERLERLIGDLRCDLDRTHKDTSTQLRALGKRIQGEAIERVKEHGKTKELLHDQIAGGLDDGYVGLIWVLCGTLFSGLTHEIAGWIS